MTCQVTWGVCPSCFGQRLQRSRDDLACAQCGGSWRSSSREPCREKGLLSVRHRGVEENMCPSHAFLSGLEKASAAHPSEKMTPDPLERAVHESGHVVVARWFGFSVTTVRIVDDDPSDPAPGATRIVWGEPPTDPNQRRLWAEQIARVCFAGFYATCGEAAPGSPEWKAADANIRDDLTFALHVLTKNIEGCQFTKRLVRLVNEARSDASILVRRTCVARSRLAEELVKRSKLTEAEIISIVDPLLPPDRPGSTHSQPASPQSRAI